MATQTLKRRCVELTQHTGAREYALPDALRRFCVEAMRTRHDFGDRALACPPDCAARIEWRILRQQHLPQACIVLCRRLRATGSTPLARGGLRASACGEGAFARHGAALDRWQAQHRGCGRHWKCACHAHNPHWHRPRDYTCASAPCEGHAWPSRERAPLLYDALLHPLQALLLLHFEVWRDEHIAALDDALLLLLAVLMHQHVHTIDCGPLDAVLRALPADLCLLKYWTHTSASDSEDSEDSDSCATVLYEQEDDDVPAAIVRQFDTLDAAAQRALLAQLQRRVDSASAHMNLDDML